MRLRLIVLLAFLWLHLQPAPSGDEVTQVVRKFETAYRLSRALRAAFVEKYSESGRLVRTDAGIAYFLKPGKMRWEYQSPERNLYVVDGKWSWFYVPTDHTVTKTAVRQGADTRAPFALLAGEVKVSKICKSVEREQNRSDAPFGTVVLRCNFRGEERPKPSEGARSGKAPEIENAYATFELNSETGALNRVVIHDPGGVRIEFEFGPWQFDPKLDGAMFQFHPPKGVAIVDGNLGLSSREPISSPP